MKSFFIHFSINSTNVGHVGMMQMWWKKFIEKYFWPQPQLRLISALHNEARVVDVSASGLIDLIEGFNV